MLTINEMGGVNWYAFFYMLSSLLSFILLLFIGWKKGYPMLSWTIILATGALFFIIGSKVATFRSGDWAVLFREGVFPRTAGKSALGGLLFAIIGVELCRSWLKIKTFVLDTYVLIVPLGLALQKPGCLIAGCCFGNPTTLPWGVQYARGMPAHYFQWLSHAIAPGDLLSLPVHPVPMYEGISYLLIFGALLLMAPLITKRGSRFFLGLALLALVRFVIEFFRAPEATLTLGAVYGGMKALQWVLLFTIIFTGTLFIRSLRRLSTEESEKWGPLSIPGRKFVWIVLLSAMICFVYHGFSAMEMLVMNLKLLPALVLFGIRAWIDFTVPRFRLTGIVILLLPLFLMGQSIPVQKGNWEYFHSFGLGGTIGSIDEVARYNEHQGSCGPYYDEKYYYQRYGMATLNYSYNRVRGYERVTFGGSLFGGLSRETEVGSVITNKYILGGIHPYIDYDSRWIGFGLGISIGKMNYLPIAPFDTRSINSGLKSFPLLPSGSFRLGPYDIVDLEYRFLDEFPTQLPMPTHQVSIGSGLGMKNGSGIRIGVVPPENGFFVSAKALISNKWLVQGKYIYTETDYSTGGHGNFVSFGLSYHLPASSKSSEPSPGN